jgi:hypothetical protein
MTETLDNSALLKEASKCSETLQKYRSGHCKSLGKVSGSDLKCNPSKRTRSGSQKCPPSLQFAHCSRNNLSHKTVSESTRSDVQGPTMKTQVIESSTALPISYNEYLSKDGAPLLLEFLNWCALSLSADETDVESSYNWVDLELEWCGRVLHIRDQTWDKIGGIFHHRIVL